VLLGSACRGNVLSVVRYTAQVMVGAVVASGADIHRPTAEQQAARAALQALGLSLEELSLVESDQLTMLDIARSLPGLPNRPAQASYAGSVKEGRKEVYASMNGDSSAHNGNGSNGAGKGARKTSAKRA
jgi:hypothetical protein